MTDWVKIPKVELHLHLEGAIPPHALWQLINKYDEVLSKTLSQDSLNSKFQFTSFNHFLDLWVWKNSFIRRPEDFSFIAQAVAQELVKQNIVYAEMFFSPSDFASTGIELGIIAEAIRCGINRVEGIKINLIADLVRGNPASSMDRTIDELLELRDVGIVGIGLGGAEQEHPPGQYKEVYNKARANNLFTTVHAGEAAGPESIWEALVELRPHRIGHGVRAIEDHRLINHLAMKQIPLEVCPYSNLRTDIYPLYQNHPVRRLFDAGIPISISTDDPAMFQTSLSNEYEGLNKYHNFSDFEIKQLLLDSIQQSFASELDKDELTQFLINNPNWNSD